MTKTAIKERILNIQAQLNIIMRALKDRPNFDIDEENWQRVGEEAKKLRGVLYQKVYGKG